MIDIKYQNAFKEVYDILKNTDIELIKKIPKKFIYFIIRNMNSNYISNIDTNKKIDSQNILKESEAILSLIYYSYWIDDEEKKLYNKPTNIVEQVHLKELFYKEDISKNNKLLIIDKKENLFKKFLNKIIKIFKK